MASERRVAGMAGMYDDPNDLIKAAERVRDAGYQQWDCHTPYPVHGLDDAMGLKPSPMPYITLCAGAVGASLALLMQWWMSVEDYPVRIGGKPLFSWEAFVPIIFESFVLFAALATFIGMIKLCKLGSWASPLYDAGVMREVTTTRMAVVLGSDDPAFSEAAARKLLEETGCDDIRVVYDDDVDGEAN